LSKRNEKGKKAMTLTGRLIGNLGAVEAAAVNMVAVQWMMTTLAVTML
jgi:hypothetical protein